MVTNETRPATDEPTSNAKNEFDYIIVGSGAGGAPLAARLARAGKKVLVIEAGSNHTQKGPLDQSNEISRVPLTHAASTEHPGLSWRFFVDHYRRKTNNELPDGIPEDPKWHKPEEGEDESHNGIFYPRAAGIGGCTIHNAMITIAGPESDWDDLASFLGDPSWNGRRMRAYFQKLEHNDAQTPPDRSRRSVSGEIRAFIKNSFWFLIGRRPDTSGGKHGFEGWLHTSFADVAMGLDDRQLVKMLKAALWTSKRSGLDTVGGWVSTFFRGKFRRSLDPNHADTQADSPEGVALIPLAVYGGKTTVHQNRSTPYAMRGRRSSPREFLLETLALYPDNLTIWTDCLVTEVMLSEGEKPRAIGVKLLRGERLYRAHVTPTEKAGSEDEATVHENGEVILCGGTFNTPQLMMLSGIGEQDADGNIVMGDSAAPETDDKIKCRVPLRGVGKNMQDRYEVSVVSEMKKDFSLLEGAHFTVPDDPDQADHHLRQWREEGTGLCTSNGGVLAILKRSRPDLAQPDLFIFGVPSAFRGYEVGYSNIERHNLFTWVVLKSQTKNRGGEVRLRSGDPLDTPKINFNYFNTGSADGRRSANDPDVKAIVDGVHFVRRILGKAKSIVKTEVHPGENVSSESSINEWIRRDAWGHHACGTCRMGPDGDEDAVLDSRFRVVGVDGLRVVDASVFPTIPGYFIVTNIYMASEKAADVILEDAVRNRQIDLREYPGDMRKMEAEAIHRRRQEAGGFADPVAADGSVAGGSAADETKSDESKSSDRSESPHAAPVMPTTTDGEWTDDVTGLALSGGGIRSATLCLGLLQGLAHGSWLRKIDLLSTVSGGGYIGSSLGRFYDRLRDRTSDSGSSFRSIPPAEYVEQELTSPHSPFLDWLRGHGNYIVPNGHGDGRTNFAIFVRNLLTVHLIVGVALFAVFCLANAIRFGLFDKALAGSGLIIDRADLPIGGLLQSITGPWFSPWFILVEVLLLFLILPRIIGYWIVSEDKHQSFNAIPLTLIFAAAGVLLYLGVKDGLRLNLVVFALAILSSLVHVEMAWDRGKNREAAVGTGGVASQRARTRNYLTYDLGLALAFAGLALAFALIDSLAFGFQEWKLRGNYSYARAFATLGGAIAALTPVARWIANFFRQREAAETSTFIRFLKKDAFAGMFALVLLILPLVLYCFTAHAIYQGAANNLVVPLAVTVAACFVTAMLSFPSMWSFVNRSSLAQVYGARLARAYLGASNPARHRPQGINITEVVPGDDVASIRNYRPHEASGPLHLINLTINQTVDFGSRLRKRDRQGTNMSVSCLGVTVGERWHGRWTNPSAAGAAQRNKAVGVEPVDRKPGLLHPFIDELERPADRAEMLSLRQWMALSGAAIDPGRGKYTNLGTALLMGLVNLRTGHWWDSGIAESARIGFPETSPLRRLLYLVPRFLTTQSLLIGEWLARYPGPWRRFWHLSDGGFFENLGVYELVRRRVPRIIACDGGADPNYDMSDFSGLVRKVRIDFDARIEPLTAAELKQLPIPKAIRSQLGTIDELCPQDGATESQKHAALCWIHYPAQSKSRLLDETETTARSRVADSDADAGPRRSLMLYVKASVTGDEPEDIRHYHQSHPEFPHESTGDQFFDEAQWESYRKLGEHSASPLFVGDWFWKIPLPDSRGGAA